MHMRMIVIAAAIATVVMPAIAQPMRPQPGPGVPRVGVPQRGQWPVAHACPAGTSWQYGCVQWAPASPGMLFGACQISAWSCKRVPGPIQ
jgi:hypothetical protein